MHKNRQLLLSQRETDRDSQSFQSFSQLKSTDLAFGNRIVLSIKTRRRCTNTGNSQRERGRGSQSFQYFLIHCPKKFLRKLYCVRNRSYLNLKPIFTKDHKNENQHLPSSLSFCPQPIFQNQLSGVNSKTLKIPRHKTRKLNNSINMKILMITCLTDAKRHDRFQKTLLQLATASPSSSSAAANIKRCCIKKNLKKIKHLTKL